MLADRSWFSITRSPRSGWSWLSLHSRVLGLGPDPMIVVDIFRLEDARIVEHRDVVQPETPAADTASGKPII